MSRSLTAIDRRRVLPGRAAILLAAALVLTGCSQGGIPGLVQVSGLVTLDGEPLNTVGIRFMPDASKGNTTPHRPIGIVDQSGKFTAMTNRFKGVPPGWYRAVLFSTEFESGGPGQPPKQKRLPPFMAKYSNDETSVLSVEVRPRAPAGSYDLRLTK